MKADGGSSRRSHPAFASHLIANTMACKTSSAHYAGKLYCFWAWFPTPNMLIYLLVGLFELVAASAHASDLQEIARWEFSNESLDSLVAHGSVLRDQTGPRPTTFPDFESNNTSIQLAKRGSYLSLADPGDGSDFDFENNEAIAIEAWVMPDGASGGALMNIVSKGRTGNKGFHRDNQNWVMRLTADGDAFHVGFLFATKPGSGSSHWHRWTSDDAFPSGTGWHHVAITYQFGKPETIRAWIDGRASLGKWDMGGPTTEPPIVDNDEIWIGNSSSNNQYLGYLDSIVIYRGLFSDADITGRFRREGQAPSFRVADAVMPEIKGVAEGAVQFSITEKFPKPDRWLYEGERLAVPSIIWQGDSFLLPRIPARFDSWGIRDSWQAPVLLRMAADITVPPGQHKIMLRARGKGRLWLDGKVIAETKVFSKKSVDGEQPVTPVAVPPAPGLRPHGYHQQEVINEFAVDDSITDNRRRMVLELIVGGKGQRTETGEVLVAIQPFGSNAWQLLDAAKVSNGQSVISLRDGEIANKLEAIESEIDRLDDSTRRSHASNMDRYWAERHERAKTVARTFLPQAYQLAANSNANQQHPVDQLIAEKIQRAKAAAAQHDNEAATFFREEVFPLLQEQCFRCHGDKANGGLKLNSRANAIGSGESGLQAVVPGKPAESELLEQVRSGAMPPTDEGLTEDQIGKLEKWIADGAIWPAAAIDQESMQLAEVLSDEAFLRRVYLDTLGVPPTAAEARAFIDSDEPQKRQRLIELLADDPRTSEHWMSFWQDLLAENPALINQSMNSTGPFRWFLYDSLRDNKSLDRMVTELIMMRGSPETGGSAAFALSGETDLPTAAKAHIIASGFLAVELQCAKCHDSPYHSTTQRDLYAIAAMIERSSVKVPKTSRVPAAFFEKKGRESLIKVTLPHDEPVEASWPFELVTSTDSSVSVADLMLDPTDSRERLAAIITRPENLRFARVMANRVWQRLMGCGIVEPIQDWEGREASHPELLDYLAYELIANNYSMNHLMQVIISSEAYARKAMGANRHAPPESRFFNAPDRRRLSAEQIVDSMHHALGCDMDCEELTFVHDGQRPLGARQTLGVPRRAWMFASLNNERDRPSLALPRAQTIVDVLEAFGWNGSRQSPVNYRELDPNVLQPGVMANGTLVANLTRVSHDSELARLAIAADSPEHLVENMFLRVLSRYPNRAELESFSRSLAEGFESRLVSDELKRPEAVPRLPLVTWFNHLQPDTTLIALEMEKRAKQGPPVDARFDSQWRAIFEDFAWSLLNHREFVWMP